MIKNLCRVAQMHDIGKIAVPDVDLQKPGRLAEEFAIIHEGSGQDFDPVIAEVFLDIRDKV